MALWLSDTTANEDLAVICIIAYNRLASFKQMAL